MIAENNMQVEKISSEIVISEKSPIYLMLLGDETHFNKGIIILAETGESVFGSIKHSNLSSVKLKGIPEKNIISENLIYRITKLISLLKVTYDIEENIQIVISTKMPVSLGYGVISAALSTTVKLFCQLFEIKWEKEEIIELIQKAEDEPNDRIINISYYLASLKNHSGNVLKIDLLDKSVDSLFIQDLSFYIIDSKKLIPNFKDVCIARKEDCDVGLEGLKLYKWGINSLRKVSEEMLMKHKNVIPKSVFNRCLYQIQERNRAENGFEMLKLKNFSKFCELIEISKKSLFENYSFDFPMIEKIMSIITKYKTIICSKQITCAFSEAIFAVQLNNTNNELINDSDLREMIYKIELAD